MSKENYSTFNNTVNLIRKMPLWIIQGLYVEIKSLLKEKGSVINLDKFDRADMLCLFIPVISNLGELMIKKHHEKTLMEPIDIKYISFLEQVKAKDNIVDLCIKHRYTLKDISKLIEYCATNRYLEPNMPSYLFNTVLLISGKLKIGEFMIRNHIITSAQLEQSIKVQKQVSSAFDDKNKIIEILNNLGYLNIEDVQDYLLLIETSEELFDIEDVTKQNLQSNPEDLEAQLNQLKFINHKTENSLKRLISENKQLKQEIDKKKKGFFDKF